MISVVIPLYNRYDLTVNCLESLTVDTDFELILVDNGSSDDTRQLDVTVRNPQNYGFARACNQGAAASSGESIVFLNNDTVVHDGWLNALRTQLVDHTIAGALLLYPDGTIQHSGVIVDFDQPPGLEARNRKHDLQVGPCLVDAVTGACLAIRRDAFEKVGGFDEGYWNGYEDVDLCLKVREQGGTVVFTPDAKVTHLESQSDPTQRFAAVRENVMRLRDRWAGVPV